MFKLVYQMGLESFNRILFSVQSLIIEWGERRNWAMLLANFWGKSKREEREWNDQEERKSKRGNGIAEVGGKK